MATRVSISAGEMESAKDGAAGFHALYVKVEPLIKAVSGKHAAGNPDLYEEFVAVANARLWDEVITFSGDDDRNLASYLSMRVSAAIRDEQRERKFGSLDKKCVDLFLRALNGEANGDPDAAADLIVGPTCSEGMAQAVRRAFASHALSIDRLEEQDRLRDETVELMTGQDEGMSAARTAKVQAVREALDSMSDLQSSLLMMSYGRGLDSKDVQDLLCIDSPTYRRNKDKARKAFHGRFDWARCFPGEKPAYLSEKEAAKGERSGARERWNDSKLKARLFPFEMTGGLRPCTLCDSPMAPGHASWCKTHTATFKARAVRAVNNGLVARGGK